MNVIVEKDVEARMRDGAILRADIYRPDDSERHGTLVLRTPYNKEINSGVQLIDPLRAAASGTAVVIQDVRGRWASEGEDFYLFRDEFDDGYDTVEWIAQLPFSNGRVGEYGISYGANTSWQTAIAAPPSLRAIAPCQTPDYFLEGHTWLTRGGALSWGMIANWSLRSIAPGALFRMAQQGVDPSKLMEQLADDLDDYDTWIRHLPLDTFPPARLDDPLFLPFFRNVVHRELPEEWRGDDRPRRVDQVRVPAMVVAGWYDVLIGADIEYFQALRTQGATEDARSGTRMLIGPWSHSNFASVIGSVDFGLRAGGAMLDLREDMSTFLVRWFDRWIGNGDVVHDDEPTVRFLVQGRNRWREADEWPPRQMAPTPWYLHADGVLAPDRPTSTAGSDSYVYDPADPCPTIGGGLVLPLTIPAGPHDQSPIVGRRDVLTYTSAPLPQAIELAGPVTATLFASTTGVDTDWVVKLCEVHPDGRVLNLCDGILRVAYRNGGTKPELVEPGSVQRYEVDLWATAALVPAGHRLAVLITSSDFPRYDRNLNTGVPGTESTDMVPAMQTIHRHGDLASQIVLPVVPTEGQSHVKE